MPSWQPSLIFFNIPIESGSIIKPCTLKHFQVTYRLHKAGYWTICRDRWFIIANRSVATHDTEDKFQFRWLLHTTSKYTHSPNHQNGEVRKPYLFDTICGLWFVVNHTIKRWHAPQSLLYKISPFRQCSTNAVPAFRPLSRTWVIDLAYPTHTMVPNRPLSSEICMTIDLLTILKCSSSPGISMFVVEANIAQCRQSKPMHNLQMRVIWKNTNNRFCYIYICI